MFPFRRTARAVPVAAVILATGCAPAQSQARERVVFAIAAGFKQWASHETPIDTVNIGVPGLHNLTAQSVRVRSVRLVAVPEAVHLLSVTAHTGTAEVGISRGDLVKKCRTTYRSYPVTDAVAAAYSDSNWSLVLAVRFAKPGKYYLRRVKIFYTIGGQKGWQYQNLFTTISVRAARPGAKPAFDGCP